MQLDGSLTIRHVQALTTELLSFVNSSVPVKLDASGISDIDTSGLQLLCSLDKSCSEVTIVAPSDSLKAAAERTGLRRALPKLWGEL